MIEVVWSALVMVEVVWSVVSDGRGSVEYVLTL